MRALNLLTQREISVAKPKQTFKTYLVEALGESFMNDLKAVVDSKFNIFHMINRRTAFHPQGELTFRKSLLKGKAKTLLGNNAEKPVARSLRTGCPTSRVLYMNGIVVPYALAVHQKNILSQLLGEPVELVHNETEGLKKDLLECAEGREGVINRVARDAIDVIKDKLKHPGDLTVVAHSQGAIVLTTAIQQLSREVSVDLLGRIKFVTFGAGVGHCVLPEAVFTEHFANSRDPVAHLGLLSDAFDLTGEVFLRKATGHFFVADYLLPMAEGDTFGNSAFEQRISKKRVLKDIA